MTDFPVLPGGADAVLAAARVRRLRRAVATGGAALLLAVAPVLLVTAADSGARDDSLVAVSPSPTASGPRDPSSSPTSSPGDATTTPSGSPEPAASSSPEPGSSASSDEESPVISQPSSSPRPARRPAPAPVTRVPGGTIETGDLCGGDSVDGTTQTWCARYTGPATAKRGQSVDLSFELCRYPTAGDAEIRFDSDLEVLAYVGSYDDPEWRAGQGLTYAASPHTATVRAGSCLRWSSAWDTRGPDGFLVVPGDYDFAGQPSSGQGLPVAVATVRVVA